MITTAMVFLLATNPAVTPPLPEEPLIMQSLCVERGATNAENSFGFDIIFSDRRFSAKVYPVSNSQLFKQEFDIPTDKILITKSSLEGEQLFSVTSQLSGEQSYSFTAQSRLVNGRLNGFWTQVVSGNSAPTERPISTYADCKFVNEDTPYDRKPL
jgi:hypothetical protein